MIPNRFQTAHQSEFRLKAANNISQTNHPFLHLKLASQYFVSYYQRKQDLNFLLTLNKYKNQILTNPSYHIRIEKKHRTKCSTTKPLYMEYVKFVVGFQQFLLPVTK